MEASREPMTEQYGPTALAQRVLDELPDADGDVHEACATVVRRVQQSNEVSAFFAVCGHRWVLDAFRKNQPTASATLESVPTSKPDVPANHGTNKYEGVLGRYKAIGNTGDWKRVADLTRPDWQTIRDFHDKLVESNARKRELAASIASKVGPGQTTADAWDELTESERDYIREEAA